MTYLAKHHICIAGRTVAPGEYFEHEFTPDRLERMKELGAVEEGEISTVAMNHFNPAATEETVNEAEEAQGEVENEAEEAEETAEAEEAQEIDAMEGICPIAPAEAKKPNARGRKKA